MQEKLVITGMGAVTPIGIGVDTYWNNLVDGKCGIDHITRFDASELPVQIAAQVKDFNPDDFMTKKQSREMDLFMQYGYAAATEALADAGIEEGTVASDRMGVVVGTAMSGVSIIAETQDGLSTGAHKKSALVSSLNLSETSPLRRLPLPKDTTVQVLPSALPALPEPMLSLPQPCCSVPEKPTRSS